jgi:iron-sulfur cluster assembly protein
VQDLVLVTPIAASELAKALANSVNIGIRLGVTGGGCAGLQYAMNPTESAIDGDLIQESHGVTFYIHPMAAPYLKGTTIDFEESLMDGGFKFRNPNASNTCGCGTSFGI